MFGVEAAPRYVAETLAAAARLQELTTAGQYAALARRAERLLDGMFTVETNLDPDLMLKIALRERFDAPRVKQAILVVATGKLIDELALAWAGKQTAAAVSRTAAAPVLA